MKRIILILFVSVLLITACKKDGDKVNPSGSSFEYRIKKLIYGPTNDDSVVFTYLNNKLHLITTYYNGEYDGDEYLYIQYVSYSYNENGNVKSIIFIDDDPWAYRGIDTTYFEYQNNRLTKMTGIGGYVHSISKESSTTKANLFYSGSQLDRFECSTQHFETYNHQTDSIKYRSTIQFDYSNNNIVKQSIENRSGLQETSFFEYDDMNNPFSLIGVKPILQSYTGFPDSTKSVVEMSFPGLWGLGQLVGISKNNIINFTDEHNNEHWEYEYNSDGFPVKAIKMNNRRYIQEITFLYEKVP